jgi:hypothetical protein
MNDTIIRDSDEQPFSRMWANMHGDIHNQISHQLYSIIQTYTYEKIWIQVNHQVRDQIWASLAN